jgi:predicted DCC family thiol-disulfide oxidoreductase YuxK
METAPYLASQTTMPRNIVFFDGVCNLCNGVVQMLIRLDTRKTLVFAPLQGITFAQHHASGFMASTQNVLDSIIFYAADGRYYSESDAALRVIAALGGVYRLAMALFLIPRPIRNFLYRCIARNRYRLFGQRETCMIPSPDVLSRFLP